MPTIQSVIDHLSRRPGVEWVAPHNPSTEQVEENIAWCESQGLDARAIVAEIGSPFIAREGDSLVLHYSAYDLDEDGRIKRDHPSGDACKVGGLTKVVTSIPGGAR